MNLARFAALETGLRFVTRRLVTGIIAMIGVTFIVFILSHEVGDPVYLLVGNTGSPAQVARLRHEYGFDQPVLVQYWHYLSGLVHGNLGISTFNRQPVTHILTQVFPATLELAFAALVIAVAIAVPIGIAAGRRPQSIWAKVGSGVLRFGVAMPSFWLGLLLIWIFVYTLHLLPAPTGELDIAVTPPPDVTHMVLIDALLANQWSVVGNALAHLVLPAVTLAFVSMPALIALARAVSARVFDSDYMRFATSNGLGRRTLYGRYAMRNLVPSLATQTAMNFGYLLGGTVLVETVFSWPGIGQYSVLSMQRLDFEPVLGVAILASAMYLLLYFLSDVAILVLDPRARHED